MKKGLLLLAVLAASSALCAQDKTLGGQDVLDAFKEHNPAALEKAASQPAYGALLSKLTAAYSAPDTPENRLEMVALVKNFDNSLALQAAKDEYFRSRTLQTASGAQLQALDERVSRQLLGAVESIFQNTLAVRKWQIKGYKADIKAVKKDKSLSKEQKNERVAALKAQIRAVKSEVKALKKDSEQKIADTARVYFADIRSEYEASLRRSVGSENPSGKTSNLDVKTKNKKPVAK